MLYYVSASQKLQALSTDEEKKLAFRDVYNSKHGSHVNLNNARVKLKSAFYWLGLCIFSSLNSGASIHLGSYIFVQIVNVRKSHWVFLSNVSSDVGLHSKCVL